MELELKERYLKAKRRLFDRACSNLNEKQREAVFTTDGPLLVIAGAGSGKTTVLVRRIAQIIKYGNAYASDSVPSDVSPETVAALEAACELAPSDVEPILEEFAAAPCAPWNMLAITFTNKAAKEIAERLEGVFGDREAVKDIWTGTFHSVCMRILRAHGAVRGYGAHTTIYDTDDTKKLLASVMKELNIDDKQFPPKTVANTISRAKERLETPEDYLANSSAGYREKIFAKIYAEYQKRLAASGALDFDDIIMQTVLLLREYADIRAYYAKKFRYICVDEYQDTNTAQFELCSLLASEWKNIMVVGDDDQSIYRFRGATIENILSFDKTYPQAKVIKLEQNYRSTKNILDAANAVIAKNQKRRAKSLWTQNVEGTLLTYELCDTQNAESRKIVDLINGLVAEGRYSYRDFAVLYRVNAQGSEIERTFAKSGVPYRICGGLRFTDRKEIKDIVAYLQLINNHADTVRLKRIINEPKRKIGETTIAAVEAIANETGASVFDVLGKSAEYVALGRTAKTLRAFYDMITELGAILEGGCPLDAFVDTVLEKTGYRAMLESGGEGEKDRLDNIEEFKSGVIEYMNANEEPTLSGFLEETSLVADVDRYDETADAVVLMTVHSAKGLEFPVAILPGMEDGIFPSQQAMNDPDELDEERRLAYVAITRAKKELYLFAADTRMLYGRTMRNPTSRFVKDIPPELICDKTPPKERALEAYAPHRTYGGAHAVGTGAPRVYLSSGTKAASPLAKDSLTLNKTVAARGGVGKAFEPGQSVKHPTFGVGEILSVKQMGSDRLYEVIFEKVGTKKLMASYAKLTPVK